MRHWCRRCAEIDALKARQKAVEDLQTDRNIAGASARRTGQADTEGVYITQRSGRPVSRAGQRHCADQRTRFRTAAQPALQPTWLESPTRWRSIRSRRASTIGAANSGACSEFCGCACASSSPSLQPRQRASAPPRPPSLREVAPWPRATASTSDSTPPDRGQQVVSQFRPEPPNGAVAPMPLVGAFTAWRSPVVVGLVPAQNGQSTNWKRNATPEPILKADRVQADPGGQPGASWKQKLQVQEYVTQLEKQPPGQGRDGCAAVGHQPGRPGTRTGCSNCSGRDRWSEGTITPNCPSIRVTADGRYHDIGALQADVVNPSRIVTPEPGHALAGRDATAVVGDGGGGATSLATLMPNEGAEEEGRRNRGAAKTLRPRRNRTRSVTVPSAAAAGRLRRENDELQQQGPEAKRREASPTCRAAAAQEVRPEPCTSAQAVEPFSNQKLDRRAEAGSRQPNLLLAPIFELE